MSELSIRVEVMAGAHIDDVARQAQEIADRLQACVRFSFGGVECTAVPGGTGERLAANWLYEVQCPRERGGNPLRAFSTPLTAADMGRPAPGSCEGVLTPELFRRMEGDFAARQSPHPGGQKDDQGPASC